jgi:hypothetical protein
MARDDDHRRERLPVDGNGEPLAPRPQPGYYPGFSTLSQQSFWDAATRKVVVDRVAKVPPIRFFTPDEATLMAAVLARVLPQDDRDERHRIPILNYLDERLFANRGEGYRYESMPPDGEAHRLGLTGIDAAARALHQKPFLECSPREQELVLVGLHDGKPAGGDDVWRRMPPHRYFLLLVKDACEAYYAHPYAWDEIGFGGPAYPRGYFRLEHGEPEPWEVEERRYEWRAPPGSPSGEDKLVAGTSEHHGSSKGGTH